ncbi:hypothetical protein RM543_00330 [Roseicyclus sp. F158]|uniref:Uncharacterized protein n=1 Tax=Tropicimonas omnivorans TaxID=3075590 RepID=A0ABU3DBL8_9RHOB|nr:hypothetical protein [Roseicyclus sp. F158]MDT0681114.1 hypothetical protein [Roseicyclus sp. F158]
MTTKLLLSAATAALLTAGGASAQVVDAFNGLSDDVLASVPASFAAVALNDMAIDGSINVTVDGVSGGAFDFSGSTASENEEEASNSSSDNSIDFDITSISSELSAATDGVASDTFGNNVDGTGAFEGSFDEDLTNVTDTASEAASSASSASNSTTELSGNINASTQSIGDIKSLAAGAVNTGNFDLTENGAIIDSSSAANTSNTMSEAMASATFGSGIGVISAAINDDSENNGATINGSITASLGAGNIGVGDIGSTAAGAINTSEVNATFFGTGCGGTCLDNDDDDN